MILLSCWFLCSDGQRMSYEKCNNGNLVNGDGSNSNCTVEKNWCLVKVNLPLNNNNTSHVCSNGVGVYQVENSCIKLGTKIPGNLAQMSS